MRACARVALVLLAVCTGLGLAGCASIDELKDTVVGWFSTRLPLEHAGVIPADAPKATQRTGPNSKQNCAA